jgi:UDP-N-acetylglucosamine/UDP-N-acetylgalactosamine 4-epimerase
MDDSLSRTLPQQIKQALAATPRRWLVTGAAGFIGSNLVEALLKLDQVVVGLDNLATGHKRNIEDVIRKAGAERARNFKFVEGDICEIGACTSACTNVDIVLHQAALGSVPRSLANPAATNQTNVSGFLNMAIAARDAKVTRFVFAASSSTYGDNPDLPKVESKIGKPLSPYAVTKLVNELYADVFFRCYGLATVGLRYFNVFGRRQDPNGAYSAVIPRWTASLIRGETIEIFGDGTSSRDFCYIDNVIQANILAALAAPDGVVGEVFNIAVGERTSLNDLYAALRDIVGARCPEVKERRAVHKPFRAGDIMHTLADITKARERLGYQPTHSLREGLNEAVEWYTENLK